MPDADELATTARKRIGQVLREKWQLDELLGVGGMAAVYSATHRNGNKAAIKLLHAHIRVGSEAMSRFLREGRVANQVHHPGAVAVLDDDVDEDGSIFVVMELLDGETLGQLVDRKRATGSNLALEDLLRIVDELLDVLATAHENGVVHRDLKPDNVFVLKDGNAKVLDFGIARLREAAGGSGHTTAEGMLMGTPEFMPPEQARGDWAHVDGQSDLWAVGATMFWVLARRPVHEAKTMSAQLVLAGTSNAPPLASVSAGVPEDVCALVDRALAFERSARWPDARSMQAQVRAIRDGAPRRPTTTLAPMSARERLDDGVSADDELPPKKKNKAALIVLLTGVVALGAVALRSPQAQRLLGSPEVTPSESQTAVVPLPASASGSIADIHPIPTTFDAGIVKLGKPTRPPAPPPPTASAKPLSTDWLPAPRVSSAPTGDPPPPEELFNERK